ncbi:ABC-type Na+ efflux pump permease subunit [Methanofollis sp. W23]|uniref:ABC transporter permease n=1 Tax=Methanofollis sp. W23 TaxID=2817849 RepID=UPI001AE13EE9|nr:ABC transporter permease [Methanofollis sp. W23]MBP2146274.1 ABC-type Na+ efflux pump permease subunit [Methanofollis sp. W23]
MNARHLWTIAKKDLHGVKSERTIVLAILLQVFIAMFSSFLVVGLTSLYDPEALGEQGGGLAIGYAGADSPLAGLLHEDGGFVVYRMDLSEAVAALKERQVSAVVYVPDTRPDAEAPVKVTLYTIKNDIQGAAASAGLKDAFEAYEEDLRDVRADRLATVPVEVAAPESEGGQTFFLFVYGLLIPLLLFLPAIISASLVIDFVTEEYGAQTLDTLLSTPVTFVECFWGKVLAAWILVPLQAGAWLLLLAANGIFIENALAVLALVSAAALALILLAGVAALHYRERTAAQFVYSTALVAVILAALAVPGNPGHLLVLLSAGAAGPWEYMMVGASVLGTVVLAALADRYARAMEIRTRG